MFESSLFLDEYKFYTIIAWQKLESDGDDMDPMSMTLPIYGFVFIAFIMQLNILIEWIEFISDIDFWWKKHGLI